MSLIIRSGGFLRALTAAMVFVSISPGVSFAEAQPSAALQKLEAIPLPLPGSPGRVGMDYLAYDPATSRLWVPAGNTGRVDIVDPVTLAISSIDRFPVATHGEHTWGPSSATVGLGFVYIGNRADSKVCAVAAKSLKSAGCVTLESMPDGVAYVATTKEVWVTTPRTRSLTVLDVSSPGEPKVKQTIHLEGEPEGYAVDAARGRFYTNLEDKDLTLVFDAKAHKQIASWNPGCGKEGPRGLALDAERQILLVACTDRVVSLFADKDGRKGGEMATGGGVDNIDYVSSLQSLYVASGRTATLTLAQVKASGTLIPTATAATAQGARVVIADSAGTAFIADSAGGRLWVVRRPKSQPPK